MVQRLVRVVDPLLDPEVCGHGVWWEEEARPQAVGNQSGWPGRPRAGSGRGGANGMSPDGRASAGGTRQPCGRTVTDSGAGWARRWGARSSGAPWLQPPRSHRPAMSEVGQSRGRRGGAVEGRTVTVERTLAIARWWIRWRAWKGGRCRWPLLVRWCGGPRAVGVRRGSGSRSARPAVGRMRAGNGKGGEW